MSAGSHRRRSGHISPIDRAGGLLARRRRIFTGGWGDEEGLELLQHELPATASPVEIVWGRKAEHPGLRSRRGQFTSPTAPHLPEPARVATVELVEPGMGAERLCVLLPAWNDHGFEVRRRLAWLVAARGIAVLSLEAAYHGSRRVTPASEPAIPTVADFARMGHSAVHETASLIATLAGDWPVLGVSGYSMGGNLAALVSARSRHPLATAPLAASHSPAPVYLDGALRHGLAWGALGGKPVAERRLRALLSQPSALSAPPLPHHSTAVLVAGHLDGYVPSSATMALAAHWPGARLEWVAAGHATLLWRHRELLAGAVADAFQRFEEWQAEGGSSAHR